MMSIIGCFYEHTHTHNKGLGREYMGHAQIRPNPNRSLILRPRTANGSVLSGGGEFTY